MSNYLKENAKFAELFHAFKAKNGITSDYAAAKALQMPRNTLHNYLSGVSRPDMYACTRLAVACGYDPITLIAELEAQKETEGPRRAFWQDFFRRVMPHAFIPALICGGILLAESTPSNATGTATYRNCPLHEVLKRWLWGRWIVMTSRRG